MLYREIMAVCSEFHTKHINTLCGQNVELLNVKLAVHLSRYSKLNESSLQYTVRCLCQSVRCSLSAYCRHFRCSSVRKCCCYILPQFLIRVVYYMLLPCLTVYICSLQLSTVLAQSGTVWPSTQTSVPARPLTRPHTPERLRLEHHRCDNPRCRSLTQHCTCIATRLAPIAVSVCERSSAI